MAPSPREEGPVLPPEFGLAEWRVMPSLNRLVRGETTISLEPKLMDVLLVLARRAERVVPKADLVSAVWPDLFVSDSVLTRAIAGLRRAFEDDARQPRFIETIVKRGYRLLVRPQGPEAPERHREILPAAPLAPALPKPPSPRAATPAQPVGQWVCGERFFGRESLLAEILDGPRNGVWLLGARAVGKTSMLKQLEHLTADGGRGYLPVYWDLEGCDEPEALDGDFEEALQNAGDRLTRLGLDREIPAGESFLAAIGRLRRALAARGMHLLLLLDEAEELIHLAAQSPALLRKLRRALLSQEGVRTVIASGARLWQLAEGGSDTSPFLHGFAPPAYVGSLDDTAAIQLVRLALSAGPGLAEATLLAVARRGGHHPYLLQLLCAQLRQLGGSLQDAGTLDAAADAVGADATTRSLFAVDYGLLAESDREILGALSAGLEPPEGPETAAGLFHLERLGVIRRPAANRFEIASPILAGWLRGRRPVEPGRHDQKW